MGEDLGALEFQPLSDRAAARPVRARPPGTDVLGPQGELHGPRRTGGGGAACSRCGCRPRARDPVGIDGAGPRLIRGAPTKVRDVEMGRVAVDGVGPTDLEQAPVHQHGDAVGPSTAPPLVVGDVDRGVCRAARCRSTISPRMWWRNAMSRFDSGSSIRKARGWRTIARRGRPLALAAGHLGRAPVEHRPEPQGAAAASISRATSARARPPRTSGRRPAGAGAGRGGASPRGTAMFCGR